MSKETTLRTVFNRIAHDYDEVRPDYPEQLIADVIALSGITDGGSILEIGCGTGQATIPFAKRGYSMLCLDIGEELAALAREQCREVYPNVEIQIQSFEDWDPEGRIFDLAVSATAFHWIPPEIGYPKVARVLKAEGVPCLLLELSSNAVYRFFQRCPKGVSARGARMERSKRRPVNRRKDSDNNRGHQPNWQV